jgi:hypothetical protein
MTEKEIKEAASCSYDRLAWARNCIFFATDQGKFLHRGVVRVLRTPVRSPDDIYIPVDAIFYTYEEVVHYAPSVAALEWKPRDPIPPLALLARESG